MRRTPRLLYIATRPAGFYRTERMTRTLEAIVPDLEVCVPDRPGVRGYLPFAPRALAALRRADRVLVGFWGQPLVPVVRLLTGKPVLLDLYALTHNRAVHEGRGRWTWLLGPIAWLIDRTALRMADLTTVHTDYHRRYYALKYRVPRERFCPLPLSPGAIPRSPSPEPDDSEEFRVHWHGRHLAHHGVEVVLRAAALLEGEGVHFTLVGGKGPKYRDHRSLADELALANVEFVGDVSYDELLERMAACHVVLGVFGSAPRTKGVVSNKVVDGFAARRAVITSRSRATLSLLMGRPAARLVRRADPEALADAIRALRDRPEERRALAAEGNRLFEESLSEEAFATALHAILDRWTRST